MGGKGPDIHVYRNSLKSYVYLLSWFLSDYSKLKESKDLPSKLRKKPKKEGVRGTGSAAEYSQTLLNEIKR